MSVRRYSKGAYVSLVWDQDGEPPAHYVYGHVTDEEFRAELARMGKPTPTIGATIEHVYICNVRAADDDWGNRCYKIRHCASSDRGACPHTYWEIEPHRGGGA